MSRGLGALLREIKREAARAERARQQEAKRCVAEARRIARETAQIAKEGVKTAARLHVEAQIEEAEALNREIADRENAIERLLVAGLSDDPSHILDALISVFTPNRFDERPWHYRAPDKCSFNPSAPSFFSQLMPGAKRRQQRRLEVADKKYGAAHDEYESIRELHLKALTQFKESEEARRSEVLQSNEKVAQMKAGLDAAEHGSVVSCFKLVFESHLRGEPDALAAEIGYSPESRHLVVDLELPDLSVVPEEASFKYVKSTDRIETAMRPDTKRKAMYGNLISQITLKCVDTVYRTGLDNVVDCLTVNSMLDAVDPATGQQIRVCLVSVRVTADTFMGLKLSQVQPEQCLRSLKASVSRSPTELLPVKPLVELDMIDPRFVATVDVLSGLDGRPNLMDLTPNEFEGLITNLFSAMGLDTRQTRPSRDGGVDCVAFDPRPVFGGKVVIQAKRYKNTVGVSAVRDLFGTVQNEGASKGILVTTSGYGKAAFDFARGKPLELLDGGNLLHLLSEHAGVEARIIMPEGWTDLPIHGE